MNHTGRRKKHVKRSQAIVRHAMRRAAERIGPIGPRAYRDMVRQIQSNKATFLRRKSNRVSLFVVDLAGVPTVATYDKQRKLVLTVWKFNGAPRDP